MRGQVNRNNIILILLLASISLSCSKEKKIDLFYFDYPNFMSPIQVNCKSIFGYGGLNKISSNDEKFVTFTSEIIDNKIKVNDKKYSIDIRYKLILKSDTLCIDNFGQIIKNGVRMTDSKELLMKIKKFIVENKKISKVINPESPIPPL